jgi:hypothetical protein
MTNLPDTVAPILAALGGRKIFAMAFTSAAYSVSPAPELTLTVAPSLRRGTKGKATHVVVTLDLGSDTYDVKTVRVGKYDVKPVDSVTGIYCDMLRETVERMTGLALTLGTMRAA